jgi:hypothetical protein
VFNKDTDAEASFHHRDADARRAAEALNRYEAWEGNDSHPWFVWDTEALELAA